MSFFKLFDKRKPYNKREIDEVAATIIENDPIKGHEVPAEREYSLVKLVGLVAEKFIEVYKITADVLYANLLKTNPESLRLYNKNNIQIYYIDLNEKFFPSFNQYIVFVFNPNAKMGIECLDLTAESYYEYDTPSFQKSEEDILVEVVNELSAKDVIYSMNVSELTFSLALDGNFPGIERDAEIALKKEASNFHSHNNYKQNYYAKNAARYAYSELDLNPIINKVNDDDFSYQIDQAIAAYDNSLYLASCATLGVCLETVCKLLLTRNGVKMKDSDSTLLDGLNEKLRENKLISFKLKGRIDVCYKVRNLAAHTSPGKVVKSDCHFILNTISEVVEGHF